ncbi:MAG: tripartite tricarboxylate transporter substrate binding protein [Burkholderiales bacterium]|nr:tripartite tricarboxylate transporter substrate binding protein [Burkholderiales bacterium]
MDGKRVARSAVVCLWALAAGGAWAWSDRPIRMIVPAPPGGTMDVVARALADQLAADSGTTAVVDNRPGAGGGIGMQAMLAAPADGLTVMVTASTVLTEIPHVLKGGFDPLKDVRPVTAAVRGLLVMVAHPGVPATGVREFVTYARANPGKLSIASYSTGTASHYAAMMLNQKAGLDLVHVPFAGSPPALTQVIGGQIPVMFDGMATSLPQIKAGKLKAFAVAGRTRTDLLPGVPSFAELDLPDVDFSNWVGVVASAALPAETVERINAAVQKAAAAPRVRERLTGAGFELTPGGTPTQLAQAVRAEHERNAGIVRAFNIRLNQ